MIRIFTDIKSTINRLHSQLQLDAGSDIGVQVAAIRDQVIARGDAALVDYAKRFDGVQHEAFSLTVTDDEIRHAYTLVSSDVVEALTRAKTHITAFHKRQLPQSWSHSFDTGITYGNRFVAIEKVGLYVPGGRAPYPSTVLMNAIPAVIAGVDDITLVTPPQKDGSIAPQILVAADICGVKRILKVGGAQAVFALAYGTESVSPVYKIVGPGNKYVTSAKQMVYGKVDIDKPAGPSEVLVYFDNEAYIPFVAAELLAQCEHDPDASVIGIGPNEQSLQALQAELTRQVEHCSRKEIILQAAKNSALFCEPDPTKVTAIINDCASEHLVLLTDHFEALLPHIKNAGSIFLGPYTPVTLGDYYGGPNHVLPTSGTAKFASPLGVLDFMKYSSTLYYPKAELQRALPDLKLLTDLEGFDAHYRAASVRLDSTPD